MKPDYQDYLKVIVKEYNLILQKKSRQSAKKREMTKALAEALVKKRQLVKKENGEIEMADLPA